MTNINTKANGDAKTRAQAGTASGGQPTARPLPRLRGTRAMLHKVTNVAGRWRALPRKARLGLSFAGVMALLITLPLLMITLVPNGGTSYFTDSALDARFDGTGMAGTAANPYVFEGLVLNASDRGENLDLGWKWVFQGTTRHVVIRDCTFVGSDQTGRAITLASASNIKIEGCRIQGFGAGILTDKATNIELTGNSLLLNQVGINISASLFVSCTGNTLAQNAVGIRVDAGSGQCSFTQNDFTRNTLAAADASTACAWSVGGVGNYYDDYITLYPSAGVTSELSSDALVSVMVASEPYAISTTAPQGAGIPNADCGGSHHDCFPLVVCPKGVPSLGVALPANNSLHASAPPTYQVALGGWAITAVYYTIGGGPEEYSILTGQLLHARITLSGTINATAWSNLGTGIHDIVFHVRNWWGQETNQTVHVEKDVSPPALIVTEPAEHAVFGSTSPAYALSASDPHLAGMSYQVGTSTTFYPAGTSGTIDGVAWLAQPDGDVVLKFRVNDTLGNTNETVVNVYKDTTSPVIKAWFDAPGTNVTLHKDSPAFTLEIIDDHFSSALYILAGISFPVTGLAGTIDAAAWFAQPDGTVDIAFHAADLLGLETILEIHLQKDTQGPLLTAIAPVANSVHGASAPWFRLDIAEPNLAQTWYSLDGGAMNFTCGTQGYFYQGAWALLGSGAVTVDFWANDTLGSTSHLAIFMQKDITPPEIIIHEPTPTTIGGYEPVTYNVTIIDVYYERAWYTVDGGISNYSMFAFAGTVSSFAWAAIPAGAVTFQVYAEDYLGNIGTSSVTFQRDLAPPNIELVLPVSGTLFGNSSPAFNFHVWDQSLARVWYQVCTGGPEFALANGPVVSGTVDAGAWLAQPDGPVYLYFHANDTAGNHDCKTVLVVKDSTIPALCVSVTSTLFGTSSPEVRCSIVDAHEGVAYYTIDQSAFQYPVDPDAASFTINAGAWAILGDGTHTLTLHGRDLTGNCANATVSFEKDVTKPLITVEVEGTGIYGQVPPTVDISVSDPHMGGSYAYIEIETLEGLFYPVAIAVDGTTGSASVQLPQAAWKHLYDGGFTITIYYTDAENNTGEAQFTVGVDKTAPTLVVTTPSTGDVVGEDDVRFGLWVSDPHLSSVWYTIDGGATNYTLSAQVGNVDPAAWASVWAYGRTVVIQFYANDACGNEACVTVVVMCESKAPLWQRIGVAGWAIIIGAVAFVAIAITMHARKAGRKREAMSR